MFFNDHDPPHFHVRYQGFRAKVQISDGSVVDGRLPPAAARIVREWTMLRKAELSDNWHRARGDEGLEHIEGL
jgi:hypothetical protein